MPLISDSDSAARLARTIVSDIALYNKEKITRGIKEDTLFDLLSEELKEGLELYKNRVSPEVDEKQELFNRAIVDILVKRNGDIESDIW